MSTRMSCYGMQPLSFNKEIGSRRQTIATVLLELPIQHKSRSAEERPAEATQETNFIRQPAANDSNSSPRAFDPAQESKCRRATGRSNTRNKFHQKVCRSSKSFSLLVYQKARLLLKRSARKSLQSSTLRFRKSSTYQSRSSRIHHSMSPLSHRPAGSSLQPRS